MTIIFIVCTIVSVLLPQVLWDMGYIAITNAIALTAKPADTARGDTQLFGSLVKCKLDGSYVNITGYAINRRQEPVILRQDYIHATT
jgi:hypothetical protein